VNRFGLCAHRQLIGQLVRREISQRYRGSALGMLWSLLQPILLLVVYTLVFSLVFQARWPGDFGETTGGYALVIFVGLITFTIFSETVLSAPTLILANRNLAKRSLFPLEVLPLVKVLSALVQATFSLGVLLLFLILMGIAIPWTAFLIPLVWFAMGLLALGVAYFLSAGGVYLRDLDQVVGVIVTALFFGSAIFYPIAQVPNAGRDWIERNPTAVLIEEARRVLLYGEFPLWTESGWVLPLALLFSWTGYMWFMKRKRGFSDVL